MTTRIALQQRGHALGRRSELVALEAGDDEILRWKRGRIVGCCDPHVDRFVRIRFMQGETVLPDRFQVRATGNDGDCSIVAEPACELDGDRASKSACSVNTDRCARHSCLFLLVMTR